MGVEGGRRSGIEIWASWVMGVATNTAMSYEDGMHRGDVGTMAIEIVM